MNARNQYLKVLQRKYLIAESRRERSAILDEYCKNARQNRKYVIRKIRSSISLTVKRRGGKPVIYDGRVKTALAKLWDIFDEPWGQRLAPLLKTEVDRLRQQEEIFICNEVAEKLKRISPRTIDRALRRQKEALHLNRKYRQKRNPLIYQKIPVKAGGWDRSVPGQLQVDLVEHCGQSASGLYGNTVSVAEVAFGWWEGEVVSGKGQEVSFDALKRIRQRSSFDWIHIHPDNDKSFINWHLFRYKILSSLDRGPIRRTITALWNRKTLPTLELLSVTLDMILRKSWQSSIASIEENYGSIRTSFSR